MTIRIDIDSFADYVRELYHAHVRQDADWVTVGLVANEKSLVVSCGSARSIVTQWFDREGGGKIHPERGDSEGVVAVKLSDLFAATEAICNMGMCALLEREGDTLKISAERGEVRIKCFDWPNDYELLKIEGEIAGWCDVRAYELKRAVLAAVKVTSNDDIRRVLQSVKFELEGGELRVVATDGRSLFVKTLQTSAASSVSAEGTICGEAARMFMRFRGGNAEVRLEFRKGRRDYVLLQRMFGDRMDCEIASRSRDDWPRWQKCVPDLKGAASVSVPMKQLRVAVEACEKSVELKDAWLKKERTDPDYELEYDDDERWLDHLHGASMRITGDAATGEIKLESTMPGDIAKVATRIAVESCPDFSLCVNPTRFLQVFFAIWHWRDGAHGVIWLPKEKLSPIVLDGPDGRAILMQMRDVAI